MSHMTSCFLHWQQLSCEVEQVTACPMKDQQIPIVTDSGILEPSIFLVLLLSASLIVMLHQGKRGGMHHMRQDRPISLRHWYVPVSG